MDLSAPTSWTHTSTPQRIAAGAGVLERAAEVVRETGGRRALLVTTERGLASDAGQQLVKALGRAVVATFDGARPHVPTSVVQQAMAVATAEAVDMVVSFGGGSCADLGKAVAFFTEQQAGMPGTSYLDRPSRPHVAVPTTWSGAELTGFFGMTDTATRRKQGAGGPTCTPVAAIYDPLCFAGLPPEVGAGTGMNCLAHGVESAWSPRRTPEAEAVALACVERVRTALPATLEDPHDHDALMAMVAGAVLGGRALQNASMGVHHGLAQLVGGRTGVPHGTANAIILTHAVAYNAADPLLAPTLRRIGEALGDADDPAGAVDRLRARLGLPGRLRDVGVEEADLEVVARLAAASPGVRGNPRPVSETEARGILDAAW